jgi:hypothetical protein
MDFFNLIGGEPGLFDDGQAVCLVYNIPDRECAANYGASRRQM